jgi:hypothetical protein
MTKNTITPVWLGCDGVLFWLIWPNLTKSNSELSKQPPGQSLMSTVIDP